MSTRVITEPKKFKSFAIKTSNDKQIAKVSKKKDAGDENITFPVKGRTRRARTVGRKSVK